MIRLTERLTNFEMLINNLLEKINYLELTKKENLSKLLKFIC